MTTTVENEATGALRTFREAPRAVKVLIFGMFVNRLGSFLYAFLVLYLLSRGYDAGRAGLASGALGLGGVFGGLIGGWLTDRIGSRQTIVAGSFGTAAATAALLYVPTYAGVLACAMLVGALAQTYRPASSALIAAHTPPARYTMVFAMYRLATNLGTAGGPLIGAALAAVSYAALFWVEALVLVLFAATALALLPPDPAPNPSGAETAASGAAPAERRRGPWRDPRYLAYLAAVLLVSTVYVQYLVGLPLQIHDQRLSTYVFGAAVAVNGILVAALEVPVTRYTQHWPARIAFTANILLIGVGMALYAVPWGVAGIIIATVVWSLGEIVGAPTMFSWPARIAPEALRGRYLGALNAVVSVAFAAGPALGAQAWNVAGTGLWLICGVLCLLGAAAAQYGMARPVRSATDTDNGGER